ncbi:pyridoxal-phosphate dependent enzyme [Staphylococcus aureus]
MITYDLIGNTPLVVLKNIIVMIKLKFMPSSNNGILEAVLKTLGKYLVEKAIQEGRVRAGQTIVEATAGNTGIGLAIAANRHHLKCKIFAPYAFQKKRLIL